MNNEEKAEKLVLEITYTDGYSYSYTTFRPFLYSSKEDAQLLLLSCIEKHLEPVKKGTASYLVSDFKFLHFELPIENFINTVTCQYFIEFEKCIMTLDEWFEVNL